MIKNLKESINSSNMLLALGCHDALGAKIAESAGFDAVYMTGNGLSASLLGAPDIGLLSMSEMCARATSFAQAVNIPIIADADTGYGNINNIRRTVRCYEASGVSAIHLEDQLFPKKCAGLHGVSLISLDEHVENIEVACRARVNTSFMIIGRTDSRLVNGFQDALSRATAYARAGADMIIIEMLQSEEEIRHAVRKIEAPVMFNYVNGKTPALTISQFRKLGVKVLCYPIAATLAYAKMLQSLTQSITHHESPESFPSLNLEQYNEILSINEFLI